MNISNKFIGGKFTMIKRKRVISLLLSLAAATLLVEGEVIYAKDFSVSVISEENKELEVKVEESKVPKQVNVHIKQ